MPLPPGYTGLVLGRAPTPAAGDGGAPSSSGAAWEAQARFEALSHWNHDAAPAHGDPLRRCLDWAAMATALHAPVGVDAVEAALAGSGTAAGGGAPPATAQ